MWGVDDKLNAVFSGLDKGYVRVAWYPRKQKNGPVALRREGKGGGRREEEQQLRTFNSHNVP